MNQKAWKIKSFIDLNVWKKAHLLILLIYNVTKDFLKEELFCLTTQLRRTIISVTSNIAEGFSRNSYKEKSQFYSMSLGSLTEVQNQLLIAKNLKYLSSEKFKKLANKTIIINKLLNGLIKKSKTMIYDS